MCYAWSNNLNLETFGFEQLSLNRMIDAETSTVKIQYGNSFLYIFWCNDDLDDLDASFPSTRYHKNKKTHILTRVKLSDCMEMLVVGWRLWWQGNLSEENDNYLVYLFLHYVFLVLLCYWFLFVLLRHKMLLVLL